MLAVCGRGDRGRRGRLRAAAGHLSPADAGVELAGELVLIDHVNRRGGLRLDGDFDDNRYHGAQTHRFAMLPYGTIMYHGAPAELRDVPLGTHLHGRFVLPPAGDTTIPPAQGGGANFVPKHNHVLTLEDDSSFYQRQGNAWRIISIDLKAGKLRVAGTVEKTSAGPTGEVTFEIDRSTRVWKGRAAAELEDLAAEQTVQLNLTWAPSGRIANFIAPISGSIRKAATWRARHSAASTCATNETTGPPVGSTPSNIWTWARASLRSRFLAGSIRACMKISEAKKPVR